MASEPTDEQKRTKRVVAGVAQLQPLEEKGHYGLFRPVYIDGWDEEKGEFVRVGGDPLGPLAIFREARKGETVHIRTVDVTTSRQIELTCVWRPEDGGEPPR
jgi:hypothetical protein